MSDTAVTLGEGGARAQRRLSPALAALLSDAQADMRAQMDVQFAQWLPLQHDLRDRLVEAMRYAAIDGGKRLRPLLVKASCTLFNIDQNVAARVAAALEAIHVYSLIHDDLPAMDDDDVRRGKPTVHKAFDEATAILAGDALQALAFQILADEATHSDPFVRIELVRDLALAAGFHGMAGGQAMDLAGEGAALNVQGVTRLQQLKTGALISFACESGAIIARVPAERRIHLRAFARDIGLAFQIVDDLLDVAGDSTVMGKTVQKDAAAGKQTFVGLLGAARAREQAELLVEQAAAHLAAYGDEADLLRAIAFYILERDR